MNTELKQKLLKSIEKIYTKAKESKLSDSYFKSVDTELELLSKYLKLTKIQAFLYANVFTLNYNGDTVDYPDLIEYFKCSPIKIIELGPDFDYLLT